LTIKNTATKKGGHAERDRMDVARVGIDPRSHLRDILELTAGEEWSPFLL
jgi:hypothetical protein